MVSGPEQEKIYVMNKIHQLLASEPGFYLDQQMENRRARLGVDHELMAKEIWESKETSLCCQTPRAYEIGWLTISFT